MDNLLKYIANYSLIANYERAPFATLGQAVRQEILAGELGETYLFCEERQLPEEKR